MADIQQMLSALFNGGIVERKVNKVVIQKGTPNGEAFITVRESVMGNTAEISTTQTLHKLDCGHFVGARGPQEIGGQSMLSKKQCCYRCGSFCQRCNRYALRSELTILEDKKPYCDRCRGALSTQSFFSAIHKGMKKDIFE
jgi:hypothetical protein